MVTVELAAAVPVLVLLLAVSLSAVDVARTRISCVDAARDGALAAARGDDAAGRAAALRLLPSAEVAVDRTGGYVTVRVTVTARLQAVLRDVSVTATSTTLIEPVESPP